MPDLWMDVDTALSEVPVNVMPLLDDSDFKTRETAIAYNESGMDLVWNFVTSAGAFTQTAVTPTTGGDYDWTHQGDGMYTIEIPATGGASVNNDTEGYGWFTGLCDGVLPWRGPTIGFRAAGINDKLCDSAYSTTRGLAGTALPNAAAGAAGGLPISAAGGLDMDTLLSRLDAAISSRSSHDDPGPDIAALNDLSAAQVQSECEDAIDVKFTFTGNDVHCTLDGETVTLANGAHGGAGASITLGDYSDFQADLTTLNDPSAAAIRDELLNRVLAGNHDAAGSTGRLIQNADVATSSRSSHSAADVTGGTQVATAESNIRGADGDDLKDLSDQIDGASTFNSATDTVTTDAASRTASKADVSGLSAHDAADVVAALKASTAWTADGGVTLKDIIAAVFAASRGRKAWDGTARTLTVYDDDDTTPLFTLTFTAAGVTVS